MYCGHARVDILFDFVPDWFQSSAMRTPIGKKVDESQIVKADDGTEITMLETVR